MRNFNLCLRHQPVSPSFESNLLSLLELQDRPDLRSQFVFAGNEFQMDLNHRLDVNLLPGGTPYNILYGEAPRERGNIRLQTYQSVRKSRVEVYERFKRKSFILSIKSSFK